MTPTKPLLAVPNVSEGRDQGTIDAIAEAFTTAGMSRLLDVHYDSDHHRSVFTLAGTQGELSRAVAAGARAAIERIDVGEGRAPSNIGAHPHVGAVDVIPLVYLDTTQRGAACTEALVVAHEVGEGLGVPVFLYGELGQGRTRAELRRGGMRGLAERLSAGEVRPDFGPSHLHPTAGATLVAAREPLVAFNLELAASATLEDAKRIASKIREGGSQGLPGVRAIAIPLGCPWGEGEDAEGDKGVDVESRKRVPCARTRAGAQGTPLRNTTPQVSTNVERPLEVPLRTVVDAVREHGEIARVELVGLAPRAALEGLPDELIFVGGDPMAQTIENALGF
jgi:glutamate formiminotransferase / 5-formyltetrahydrofolate cyclo-ligase